MIKRLLGLAVFALVACDAPSAPRREPPIPGSPAIDEADLLHHLGVLADDSMAGRWAGSREERQAAAYLRDQFKSYHLGPGTPKYFQVFPLPHGGKSQNVLAILPGEGSLAGQWVVIGAHYDAQGVARFGADSGEVNNGADDNASGTAMLLEVAWSLRVRADSGDLAGIDRRSVLFMGFGGEEPGLIGSRYFCQDPTIDMDSLAAMLNMDMVGRYAQNGLWTIGLSTSGDWPAMLGSAGVSQLVYHGDDTRHLAGSDQNCFLNYAKPVLFFFTGLHADYHKPSDDVALIDTQGMVTIGNVVSGVLAQLLVRPTPPIFTAR